jgi:hypothetical protein
MISSILQKWQSAEVNGLVRLAFAAAQAIPDASRRALMVMVGAVSIVGLNSVTFSRGSAD